MKEIGNRLQELRESKGLSQSDLAKYLGISQPLLSQIESGNRNLNLSLLDKLCSLFGCSDSYILCKSDEYNSIDFSFRSKNAAREDLDCISSVHKIILNMRFLNKLDDGENERQD
ncbi:MAG: helix-turn-helix domain-containing protein [archaeon]|jgi:transcriptional regulator with XRE-family HTH domain|nr:helix-turn-helix domain-containing protein [archaeon]